MWVIGKASRRPRRLARATGTAASQGFRAASRAARGAPHRRATRSWSKTLGSRLYGSLSTRFGISVAFTAPKQKRPKICTGGPVANADSLAGPYHSGRGAVESHPIRLPNIQLPDDWGDFRPDPAPSFSLMASLPQAAGISATSAGFPYLSERNITAVPAPA